MRAVIVILLLPILFAGQARAGERPVCTRTSSKVTTTTGAVDLYPYLCKFRKQKFKCKRSYSTDGCSTGKGRGWKKRMFRKYNPKFYQACVTHDTCYAFGKGGRLHCNAIFLSSMQRVCDRIRIKGPKSLLRHKECRRVANLYAATVTVRKKAKPAFNRARKWRSDNCIKM